MTCKKCGTQLEENSTVCTNCGVEISEAENQCTESEEKNDSPAKYSAKGIAGFVLSLVGIIVAAIPCGIIGVIFSSLALKEVELPQYKGKGFVISGLVVSIIDIVLGIVQLV